MRPRGWPPQRRSPFAETAPGIVFAAFHAIGALAWTAFGSSSSRWLAVHLFTLGVVTNLVLAFTGHFGVTLTRSPTSARVPGIATANLAIVAVLAGMTSGQRWPVAIGGTWLTVVVVLAYRRLRNARRAAVGARFTWVVRIYERAHGAFIHGAVLGMGMGLGLLGGAWYGPARTAHLHVNVLGWGGLTLLATLVFFGPTMVHARIGDGADDRAAGALRQGATGLTVAVLLLLATGVGGNAATALRLLAAASLAVYARGATVTCLPVVVVAHGARATGTRWSVIALCVWFPLVAWADVLVVATGSWRYLDALGLAMILLVLAQAMIATLTYLSPMLLGSSTTGRAHITERLKAHATARTAAHNIGAAFVVSASVIRGTTGHLLTRTGWALIALGLASLTVTALPLHRLSRRDAATS